MRRIINSFLPQTRLRDIFRFSKIGNPLYLLVDRLFIFFERRMRKGPMLLGVNSDRIPYFSFRIGGAHLYSEWAYRMGLWRALLYRYIGRRQNAVVVDIGCGTGIMAPSVEFFVHRGGAYLGIDIDAQVIDFCRAHYAEPYFKFAHHAVHNAMYGMHQAKKHVPYPAETAFADVIVAISVWTHLPEDDARFYMREVARILRPDGHAFITMLSIDAQHAKAVAAGKAFYVFARSAYRSSSWRTEGHARVPEYVIGITREGIDDMLAQAGLVVVEYLPGRWKDDAGLYIQDVFVLRKK